MAMTHLVDTWPTISWNVCRLLLWLLLVLLLLLLLLLLLSSLLLLLFCTSNHPHLLLLTDIKHGVLQALVVCAAW